MAAHLGCAKVPGMEAAAGTTETIPDEALDLHESISLEEASAGSVFDDKGRVKVHIIRPGIGKGRGRHLYEAKMLEEHAHIFGDHNDSRGQKVKGWKMFVDHLSPEARKAAGGLPRSIRDLGGRITESFWDPSVPANPSKGHGPGAVVGYAKPVPFVRELIENDPDIVEASISASASAVRPVVRDGQRVWMVEGINPRGSVDWVTEAGAGGRVVPLMEAAYSTEGEMDRTLLEAMDDDEFMEFVEETRPDLVEAFTKKKAKKSDSDDDGDAGADDEDSPNDELNDKIEALVKKGMPRKLAERAAKSQKLNEAATSDEGEDDMEITPEALSEALAENPGVLVEALKSSEEGQEFLGSLIEARLEEEREVIRAEAKADADRSNQLRDLRDAAHTQIAESVLPESWQADLKARFQLVEGKPTDALDVIDETDEFGNVTKPAAERLTEAVNAEIERETARLREVSPTRVRGQGPRRETKDGEKIEEGADDADQEKPYWATFLSESGVDPEAAFKTEARR